MVDCAGPWKARVKTHSGEVVELTFFVCSMFGSCTGWVELATITSASSKKVSRAVEKNWIYSKPRPAECGHDNGPEFMGQDFQALLAKYDIKANPTTVKNPQAQSLVERIHLVLANQLRVRVLEEDTAADHPN